MNAPIAYSGVLNTRSRGLNDNGVAAGRIDKGDFLTFQAIIYERPSSFTAYSYPGASNTSFNDINNSGLICGKYSLVGTYYYGILAQATPKADEWGALIRSVGGLLDLMAFIRSPSQVSGLAIGCSGRAMGNADVTNLLHVLARVS